MARFDVFVRGRARDPNLATIIALADNPANSADWPAYRDDIAPYVEFVIDKAPPADRERLVAALVAAFGDFARPWRFPWGTLVLGIAALAVGGALIYGIFWGGLIELLSTADAARGLITFLFASGTIAVVLIVAVAIFWVDVGEIASRFAPAKDVLTILIGVFGTILGFYFGSVTGEKGGLAVNDVAVAEDVVAPGGEATITGVLSGGTGPYAYAIAFDSHPPEDIARTVAADGAINAKAKVSAENEPRVVRFTVTGSDSAGHEVTTTGRIFVAPDAAAPANADQAPTPPSAPASSPAPTTQ